MTPADAPVLVIQGCAVATVDGTDSGAGTEFADGHLVVSGNRIAAVGPGPAAREWLRRAGRLVDGRGCLLTPGLVNTHHHLYQWITRGYAQDSGLFRWLTTLYPVWERLDEDAVHAAAAANLGWLSLSGCTLSTDHHYVFPRSGGDLLAAEIRGAQDIGIRFHPTRGSMDLGQSAGGLPPDSVVEDTEAALIATEAAITNWHDPSPDAMLQIGVSPCSPFSVTRELMVGAAALARRHAVRIHTHLCETLDENDYCQATLGMAPVDYMAELGWLGPDVWYAHCVWPSAVDIERFAATGTSVAHCPSSNGRLGSGIAPVADMIKAGVAVGLGVDGAASNESGWLADEPHQALLLARLRGGPAALTAREALRLGTFGGANVLGRSADLGSLEAGKLADVALWRVDGLGSVDISDPVCALVFGSRLPLELLLVDGRSVVEHNHLVTADEDALAHRSGAAARRLASLAGY